MRELIYAAVGVVLGALIFMPFALLGISRILLQIREELESLRIIGSGVQVYPPEDPPGDPFARFETHPRKSTWNEQEKEDTDA